MKNVEKFLPLVKNEHRLTSPYSYKHLFQLILYYFWGSNSTYLVTLQRIETFIASFKRLENEYNQSGSHRLIARIFWSF
jgi:hypothetical protein